jgi:predicted MFS family arabinose efflux permease
MLALPGFAVFSADLTMVVMACLVRGLGLGIILVAAGGLAAALAPVERRSEALGIYGFAAALPAILFVPLGVIILSRGSVMSVAGATVLSGLASLLALGVFPGRQPAEDTAGEPMSWRPQVWPALTLVIGATLAGAVVTYLPVHEHRADAAVTSLALLLHGLAGAVSRLAAGPHGDRHGPVGIIGLGLAATAAGAIMLGISFGAVSTLAGAGALGIGFGLLQSGSLTLMLARASQRHADAVSTAWNIAYDAGLGAGGLGFGLISAGLGYGGAFAVLAVPAGLLLVPLMRLSGGQASIVRKDRRPACES